MDEALIREHLLTAQTEISEALRLMDATAPPPQTIVRPGDNLMEILLKAEPNAMIGVDPLCVFDLVEYTLPKPVTLKSTFDPGPTRVSDALAGPIIRGAGNMQPGTVLSAIRLEASNNNQTILSANDAMVLDRCVVYGHATGAHRGVRVDAADLRISKCHIGNIWKDIDTQAICGWDGTKRLLVEDCYLEASGENVMFGGDKCRGGEGNIPQDIVITDSYLFKPMSWRGKPGCGCKNLYELKNAKRVTLRRSILENSFVSAQIGWAITLSVRAESTEPWATIADCIIEDCTTKNTAGGLNILGRDDSGEPGTIMSNMVIRRNKFLNINPKVYGDNGRQLQIAGGPDGLTIEDNTWDGANLNTAMNFVHPNWKVTNFRYTGNRAHEGAYGIHADGSNAALGKASIDFQCPGGYVWERNTIVDYPNRNIPYPSGTTLVPLSSPLP